MHKVFLDKLYDFTHIPMLLIEKEATFSFPSDDECELCSCYQTIKEKYIKEKNIA